MELIKKGGGSGREKQFVLIQDISHSLYSSLYVGVFVRNREEYFESENPYRLQGYLNK